MKWMSMMKYTAQGAASVLQLGATGRRDAVAQALAANGAEVLHWWHSATPEWDVIMVIESEPDYAIQATFTTAAFASGDMARAITVPLVEPEEIDATEIVPHPSSG